MAIFSGSLGIPHWVRVSAPPRNLRAIRAGKELLPARPWRGERAAALPRRHRAKFDMIAVCPTDDGTSGHARSRASYRQASAADSLANRSRGYSTASQELDEPATAVSSAHTTCIIVARWPARVSTQEDAGARSLGVQGPCSTRWALTSQLRRSTPRRRGSPVGASDTRRGLRAAAAPRGTVQSRRSRAARSRSRR